MKPKILYCRCAFAQVVPQENKDAVLQALCDSGVPFETVSDLCEMSARKDPELATLLSGEAPVKIAACYPRAVKWLFHSAGVDFPEIDENGESPKVSVLNMREQDVSGIVPSLLESQD